MSRSLLLLAFALAAPAYPASAAQQRPVPVVFDTDMGNDIDDTLALAVLHALESRGEVRIIAVTTTKDQELVGPAIDALNTFYLRGSIPIGTVRKGKTPENSPMLDALTSDHFPRRLRRSSDAPDAAELLRKVLFEQADKSVVVIQVGFSTNLARLLTRDRALVEQKVRLLVTMAGDFSGGHPEFNIAKDIPAAQQVFRDWPAPVVTSPFEIGNQLLYPARSIENDFHYVAHHPVAEAYRAYAHMPYDRPTWDLTAALYAARPDDAYFALSPPGRIRVDDRGKTTFQPDRQGLHRYLLVRQADRARILECLRTLASEPPQRR